MRDNGIRVEWEHSDYSDRPKFDFEALRQRQQQAIKDALGIKPKDSIDSQRCPHGVFNKGNCPQCRDKA